MNLTSLVAGCMDQDSRQTVYARMMDGNFTGDSDVVLLTLTDKEHDMDIDDVARRHCPGYDYFMELSMIQDMAEEMKGDPEYGTPEKQVARILHFLETDE